MWLLEKVFLHNALELLALLARGPLEKHRFSIPGAPEMHLLMIMDGHQLYDHTNWNDAHVIDHNSLALQLMR